MPPHNRYHEQASLFPKERETFNPLTMDVSSGRCSLCPSYPRQRRLQTIHAVGEESRLSLRLCLKWHLRALVTPQKLSVSRRKERPNFHSSKLLCRCLSSYKIELTSKTCLTNATPSAQSNGILPSDDTGKNTCNLPFPLSTSPHISTPSVQWPRLRGSKASPSTWLRLAQELLRAPSRSSTSPRSYGCSVHSCSVIDGSTSVKPIVKTSSPSSPTTLRHKRV